MDTCSCPQDRAPGWGLDNLDPGELTCFSVNHTGQDQSAIREPTRAGITVTSAIGGKSAVAQEVRLVIY